MEVFKDGRMEEFWVEEWKNFRMEEWKYCLKGIKNSARGRVTKGNGTLGNMARGIQRPEGGKSFW